MISLDLGAGLVFFSIFSGIIIVPCFFLAILGRRLINTLGRYPSNAPVIQMSSVVWLLLLEIVTFFSLISFYRFFAGASG
jgi:hypothetical protein